MEHRLGPDASFLVAQDVLKQAVLMQAKKTLSATPPTARCKIGWISHFWTPSQKVFGPSGTLMLFNEALFVEVCGR